MTVNIATKQATWETPRNIAILATALAAIFGAIFGVLGFKIGSAPPAPAGAAAPMSDTPADLTLLAAHLRELRRQMAMLQAGMARLPTRDQVQAGLTQLDKRLVELGSTIADKVTAAIGDRLATIEAVLTEVQP